MSDEYRLILTQGGDVGPVIQKTLRLVQLSNNIRKFTQELRQFPPFTCGSFHA